MLNILRERRSIRQYQERKIELEKVELLKEAVLRAPSGKNAQPCEFIFVDDREVISKLSTSKPGGARFLEGAPLAIVVLGDENKSDTWIEDCSIASTIAHCTAHSIGLGSCWIQISKRPHSEEHTAEEYVQELMGIPRNLRVVSIIAIGYGAEEKPGHPESELDFSRIKKNSYR